MRRPRPAASYLETRLRVLAAGFRPSDANSSALSSDRGRRESRAPTAPAAPCAMVVKESTRVRQVQPRHPGFPRAMVLRLIRTLPGERPFLPPLSARYFAPT